MRNSGYQVEILVKQFARLWGLWQGRNGATLPDADAVELTEQARALARSQAPSAATAPRGDAPRDETPYPPLVRRELERRAGSFMEPPYEPEDAPPVLPRLPVRRP